MKRYVNATQNSESVWEEVASKTVEDSNGFPTDYTMYTDGDRYIFMFGDKEIYTPDPDYADWEAETEERAWEWFNSYNGFADEDDDEYDLYGAEDIDDSNELSRPEQEFDSAKTSINSAKLPAIYRMISIPEGSIGLDFGGGAFDNAIQHIKDLGATLYVYDPYNRSAEYNKQAIKALKANGGADWAVNSNVLNVIKEPEARRAVLENISKITKPGAPIYITVYEGRGDSKAGPTKSGYQLNRKTQDYLEDIQEVFPDAVRKGRLITAHNIKSESLSASISASEMPGKYGENIFRILDDMSGDELIEFVNSDYNKYIDSELMSVDDIYNAISEHLERDSGAWLLNDLEHFCDSHGITASTDGYVYTFCDNCGKKNRVKVTFKDYKSPFTDTEFTCINCGAHNLLHDPHVYDEDGYIIESTADARYLSIEAEEDIYDLDKDSVIKAIMHRMGINKDAASIIYSWYDAEDAFEDFDSLSDLVSYVKDDIYDMLDACTDDAERAIVDKALRQSNKSVNDSTDSETSERWAQINLRADGRHCYCGFGGSYWVAKDSKMIDTWPTKEEAISDGKQKYNRTFKYGRDWDVVKLDRNLNASDELSQLDQYTKASYGKNKYSIHYNLIDCNPNADPQTMLEEFRAQVSPIHPYDDADYAWASIKNGRIIIIRDGKSVNTYYYFDADDMDVENTEWCDAIMELAMQYLEVENKDVTPRIIHNSTNIAAEGEAIASSTDGGTRWMGKYRGIDGHMHKVWTTLPTSDFDYAEKLFEEILPPYLEFRLLGTAPIGDLESEGFEYVHPNPIHGSSSRYLKASYDENILDAAKMSFETGHRFHRNDFESKCEFDSYKELMDLGPAGFYDEYKDTLDFDPEFVSEYGDQDHSINELNKIKNEIESAAKRVMMSPEFEFEASEVKEYSFVDVNGDGTIAVRAEVDYDGLETLMSVLNPIIQKYDKDSYFEPVEPGIIEAYIDIDNAILSSETILGEEFVPVEPFKETIKYKLSADIVTDGSTIDTVDGEISFAENPDTDDGNWYYHVLDSFEPTDVLRTKIEAEDDTFELLPDELYDLEPGKYHITADVELVYEIEGIWVNPEDSSDVDTTKADIWFDKHESTMKNLKVTTL